VKIAKIGSKIVFGSVLKVNGFVYELLFYNSTQRELSRNELQPAWVKWRMSTFVKSNQLGVICFDESNFHIIIVDSFYSKKLLDFSSGLRVNPFAVCLFSLQRHKKKSKITNPNFSYKSLFFFSI